MPVSMSTYVQFSELPQSMLMKPKQKEINNNTLRNYINFMKI